MNNLPFKTIIPTLCYSHKNAQKFSHGTSALLLRRTNLQRIIFSNKRNTTKELEQSKKSCASSYETLVNVRFLELLLLLYTTIYFQIIIEQVYLIIGKNWLMSNTKLLRETRKKSCEKECTENFCSFHLTILKNKMAAVHLCIHLSNLSSKTTVI